MQRAPFPPLTKRLRPRSLRECIIDEEDKERGQPSNYLSPLLLSFVHATRLRVDSLGKTRGR